MAGFLTQRDIGIIVMDITTIFLCLGIIFQSKLIRENGGEADHIFFRLLQIDILVAISEAVSYLGDEKTFPGAKACNFLGITVFYIFFGMFSILWLRYTDVRFCNGESVFSKHRIAVATPMIIIWVLLIVNIFGKFIFWVDENNVYHRGVLFIPMYVVFLIYLFTGFGMIFRYRRKTGRKNLVPVWLYIMPLVLVLVVPFVFGGVSMCAIGVVSGLVFTHIGSMNEQVAKSISEG